MDHDAILSCQIDMDTQTLIMEVQWLKLSGKTVINIYQFDAATRQEIFGPGYQQRAKLATNKGTETGDVAMELKNVRVSDEGTYSCVVKTSHGVVKGQTVLHITGLKIVAKKHIEFVKG